MHIRITQTNGLQQNIESLCNKNFLGILNQLNIIIEESIMCTQLKGLNFNLINFLIMKGKDTKKALIFNLINIKIEESIMCTQPKGLNLNLINFLIMKGKDTKNDHDS